MHEKKAEYISYIERRNKKAIDAVAALPEEALAIYGMDVHVDISGNASLHFRAKSLDDALVALRSTAEALGAYSIKSYWVPYEGCICITYKFESCELWFSIDVASNIEAQRILDSISSGRCRIASDESFKIVCDL